MKMRYEFNPDDAWRFARENGYKAYRDRDELMFKLCPYCKGGSNSDKGTFSINLKTGMFKCFRDSCGRQGNMITLAQDFDFKLSNFYGESLGVIQKQFRKLKRPEKPIEPKKPAIAYLESRGISEAVAKRYEITTQTNRDNVLVFPFYDQDGELVFIKYRKTDFDQSKDKAKEWSEANCKPILFGMKQCSLENKTLIITEGQIDSLSVAEAGFQNAVSVPTGAKGFTWVPYCYDFVEQFDTIIVFGDHEKGHVTLLDEIRARFKKRIKCVREDDYKDCKDANDILRKYGKDQIRRCIENAKEILIPCVKELADVGIQNIFDIPKLQTGISVLDRILYGGLPFGGVTLIAGKPGEGKSTLASQIIANAIRQKHKVFVYSGELPNELFRAWLDFQVAGANHIFQYQTRYGDTGYNISDSNRKMISEWYRGNIYIYDSNGVSDESEGLIKTAESMILRNGCDVILIDNLMTALDLEATDERDKYERQSKFVKKLTRLCLTYGVLILLVAHKRKNNYSQNENDEISGSGDIANLGMVTLAYEKNNDLAPEQRLLKVSKNRLFGKTNTEGWVMEYDERSKRIYNDISELKAEFGWNTLNNGFVQINMEIGEENNEIPF